MADVTLESTPVKRRSARKAKGDGHLRRGEILDAAERIFVAEGYEGATIRKIADEVGVSSTALYMHFPDKACILGEIARRTLEQLLARNRELAARPLDPELRLRLMLEAYMRWGLAHPNAYLLVYSAPRPPTAPLWPEAALDLSARCYEIFAAVVGEIAAQGRLRAGAADSAAQTLWMSCHGVVALLCARPNFNWAPAEELVAVALDGLINGFVADGPSPRP
jgi:AcrR family transcriptional regulator